MAERKKETIHSAHRLSKRKPTAQAFYTPFRGLDQHLTRVSQKVSPPAREIRRRSDVSAVSERPEDADMIFREAMADVVPLVRTRQGRVPSPSPTKVLPRFLQEEELEVYSHLVNLVAGEVPFELSYSDEYVEGAVVGLSPETLKKLRRGEFSYQEYTDLHGLNRKEGRDAVVEFVRRGFARKLRCILIVSGRGLNSEGKEPVLKHSLVKWLTHAPLRRYVLAFSSARSFDGGAGAFYVLLRKNEGKAPFVSSAE
jgi:DNA-nicking Smr family endonuclease